MDNRIYVTDDNGNEVEMLILFTFEHEGNNYAILQPKDDEDSVFPFKVINDNELAPVEDPEEFELVSEVYDSFVGIEDEA